MGEHNIIYNVTIKVDKDVEQEWCQWMKEKHIPDVISTGCFMECRFNKVLFFDDEEGAMYTAQYLSENMSKLQEYQGTHALILQKKHQDKYKDQYVAFRSVMEVIEKYN